jgi:hypothetical protein
MAVPIHRPSPQYKMKYKTEHSRPLDTKSGNHQPLDSR